MIPVSEMLKELVNYLQQADAAIDSASSYLEEDSFGERETVSDLELKSLMTTLLIASNNALKRAKELDE